MTKRIYLNASDYSQVWAAHSEYVRRMDEILRRASGGLFEPGRFRSFEYEGIALMLENDRRKEEMARPTEHEARAA